MREIIHLQVGQCGNQVWDELVVVRRVDWYQVLGGDKQGTPHRQQRSGTCGGERRSERVLQSGNEREMCSSSGVGGFVLIGLWM